MKELSIETDDEATDILANMGLDSRELRSLASNAGVSRKRGDTKRQTARRIVDQDPALAARMIDNDAEVAMDASAFAERREVGEEYLSLEEAERRARSDKMRDRLNELRMRVRDLVHYDARVKWECGGKVRENGYEPGLTSVVIVPSGDVNPLLCSRGHIILRPTGRALTLDVSASGSSTDYADRDSPGTAWLLFTNRLESFYDE